MFGLKSQEGHYALRSIKNINNSKEMTKWTVQHVVMAWMVVALVECVAGLPAFPLSTKGSVVVDADGNRVKFAGVNWYGFDSTDFVAGGLQVNTIDNIVGLIADWGFTAIRIPWSLQLWETNPFVNATLLKANPDLIGLHALDVLDRVIEALAAKDILIMLDNHVSNAEWCCSESDGNGLWFNEEYPISSFYNDWRGMVARYKNEYISHVVAVDIRNELRCSGGNCPNWGGGGIYVLSSKNLFYAELQSDWRSAAEWIGNAIHEINPNLLIVVEGIAYASNLTQVKQFPVTLNVPNKVVYSAHNYGWGITITTCESFYNSTLIPHFAYIVTEQIAPLFVGEWGTCYTNAKCVSEQSAWMECFTSFLKDNDMDWFYWAIDGTESSGAGRTLGAPETFGLTDVTWSNSSWPWFLENKLQTMQ